MALRSRFWLAVMVACCCVAAPANSAELALKRVVLSTGGVGYFEYEAEVDGDAALTLDVALDQVDDVLKSLVVYDSGGTAGEITLPGREPLAKIVGGTPFENTSLNSLADLLNGLSGAELRIDGPQPASGRLVHVYPQNERIGEIVTTTRFRLALMTDAGLRQVMLDDVGLIAFTDAELQQRLMATLAQMAGQRADKLRRLTLHSRGSGTRRIRVGYVAGTPLWKSTYRLSLPADGQPETGRLQGWAVLENFTGQPWREVELTLLSGNLVTFRQALYESYYVTRPSVPVEMNGRILPQPDTGSLASDDPRRSAAKAAPPAGLAAPAQAPPAPPASTAITNEATAAPAPPPAAIESAEASEGAAQIAFTLPYKVSVGAGQSLLVPILDRELPAQRIDLYQATVDRQHPLAAIAVSNNGDTGLPPGVLTLYQQNAEHGALYLGDARLAAFPAGDKRLLSYAMDSKVTIDRNTAERRLLVKASIADGVLRVTRLLRQTTSYRVKATAAPPVQLIIEHPRHPGMNLTEPGPSGVETTAGAYRIPVGLAGPGDTALRVVEDQPLEETMRLLDIEDDQLGALVASTELDGKLRQALTDLAARRQAVARQRAELDRLKEQREQLVADETRLRDDLTALGREQGLRKRLLDKFTETVTAIDTATAAIAKAESTLAAAQNELASFVAALAL
jgi:hypothetical protein